MKSISCLAALEPYGIVPLTVEPDALRYRVVCDVTAKGKVLLEKALGVVDLRLAQNWDYGPNNDPHIGSIMLVPEMLPILGAYALFDDGCHEIWVTRNEGVFGIQHGDPQAVVESLEHVYGKNVLMRFTRPETIQKSNPNPITWSFH